MCVPYSSSLKARGKGEESHVKSTSMFLINIFSFTSVSVTLLKLIIAFYIPIVTANQVTYNLPINKRSQIIALHMKSTISITC